MKKKNRFIKKIETIPITVQLLIIIGYNKFPSIYTYKIINNDYLNSI